MKDFLGSNLIFPTLLVSGKNSMKQGKIDTCCGYGDGKKSNYDCVRIPSASKEPIKSKISEQPIKSGSGFCGNMGLVSTMPFTALATICCKFIFSHTIF